MRLQVTDDSGFLALLDPDTYSGFVAEDWALDALFDHFRREMAAQHLLIWGTGQNGSWTVAVLAGEHPAGGVREISGSITSSRGRLLLTNYESLTMAAQFPDVVLPEKHQASLLIPVPPAHYACRIVQHAMKDQGWRDGCPPEFTLVLTEATDRLRSWEHVPWTSDLLRGQGH